MAEIQTAKAIPEKEDPGPSPGPGPGSGRRPGRGPGRGPKAPFTRERNRSVPSSFQFLERKKRLFTRERNNCVSVFVSVHTGTQSFRSTVFSLVLAIFSRKTISTHALRAKILSLRFLDQSCTLLPVHTGMERNDCVSFYFSYDLFYRSTFWNGTMLLQAFPCERNP